MSLHSQKEFVVFSGGNDRAVLGFLRTLTQCGRSAHIIARTRKDPILATSYRSDVDWVRQTHELNLEIFTTCLAQVRKSSGQRPLVLLPSSEYFNAFLLRHRAEIERMNCEIPLVNASVYNLLTNKSSAINYFAGKGFFVPHEVAGSLTLVPPVVAKPRRNVSLDGRSLYPMLLLDRDQLAAFRACPDASDYFFQEYLQGDSFYLLFYLPRRGGQTYVWSQRNLLQQPNGKSMLLAEPADLHRSDTAARFTSALVDAGFWGLGMIEIIRTGDRDVFIEMNPRIWGPVQLAVDHQQPLLRAMIGEALHDDPDYFLPTCCTAAPARKRYFWCGGLVETLASRQKPIWHAAKRPLSTMMMAGLRDDVYLRADSWRCFLQEATKALKLAWHRDRTQD